MLLWLRYSGFDDVGDALKASIAPKRGAGGQIRSHRCANTAGTVTPCARRPTNLAMEDLLAERDLLARGPWRYGVAAASG